MGNYRKLNVWIRAKELCIKIYYLTDKDPFRKNIFLQSQIRRASFSIPSNIAEGEESGSNNQSLRFFRYAKASLAETLTQLEIAYDIGFLEQNEFLEIQKEYEILSKMIYKIISYRSK